MNKGIEILMARMDSNPDEFTTENGKFFKGANEIISGAPVTWWMEDADRSAFTAKLKGLMDAQFTKRVVERMMDEPKRGDIASDPAEVNDFMAGYAKKVKSAYEKNAKIMNDDLYDSMSYVDFIKRRRKWK
jgi:hypothetical protein